MTENLGQIFAASALEYDAWFDRHRLVYASEIKALKRFSGCGGSGNRIVLKRSHCILFHPT